jgi:hypothetical protein
MGIKDWFGGDKKKAEYREKVKEAVSDGRLSATDMFELEKVRTELGVSDARDDKTVFRREIYNEAVDAVREKGKLGPRESAELAKIQKFLALRDDQVEATKWDLARLKTLTEIRGGNLPMVPPSNVALRGLPMVEGEIAHYTIPVDIMELSTTRGSNGVQAAWGKGYSMGSAHSHVVPEDGAKDLGEGTLIITNQRLLVRTANKLAATRLAPDAQVFLYRDGIRLQRTVGNTMLKFRSKSEDTGEIIGELLGILMK